MPRKAILKIVEMAHLSPYKGPYYKYKPEAQAYAPALPRQAAKKVSYPIEGVPPEEPERPRRCRCQPTIDRREYSKPRIVKIRLRGHRLSLLRASTTDPEALRKEAAHFDGEISYWERLGCFETLTSMRGRLVVQYDRTDVDEAGIPKAVIGITEEIISVDTEEPEDEGKKNYDKQSINETEEEKEQKTMQQENLMVQLGTSRPRQERSRNESPKPTGAQAKKHRWSHCADYGGSSSDTDTDTDTGKDDEPLDWTEYENVDVTTEEKKDGSDGEVGMLDTRVDFVKIDLISPEAYESACMSDEAFPRFCDCLIRGQTVPELGDLTPMEIIHGWQREASEAMTAK